MAEQRYDGPRLPNMRAFLDFKPPSQIRRSEGSQQGLYADSISNRSEGDEESYESPRYTIPPKDFSGNVNQPVDVPMTEEAVKEVKNEPATDAVEPKAQREPSTKFEDHKMAFAIDCSASTMGGIIAKEIATVESTVGLLSHDAASKIDILPWNHSALGKVDLRTLRASFARGGTDPTVLTSNKSYKSALKDASLWLLLTDGEIGQQLVEQFAVRLCSAGLHGTSCIIMLFGPTVLPPAQCNISVGQAVFAVSPNCLFLYCDIHDGTIYVLQYKGYFRTALHSGKGGIALDAGAVWSQLPTFDLNKLKDLGIPNPVTLDKNHIMLPNGLQFSMRDIYHNTLSPDITKEIFGSNENLNTVILTGMTRGREVDVQNWISKQKIHRDNPLWAPRTDIHGKASRLVEQLLDMQAAGNITKATTETVQSQLRDVYKSNWDAFLERINLQEANAKKRDVVIKEISDHISSTTSRFEDDRFSTVSLSRPSRSLAGWEDDDDDDQFRRYSRKKPISNTPTTNYIYLPGYEVKAGRGGYRHRHSPLDGLYGLCQLCGGRDRVLCLLLTTPPTDISTPGFPAPNGDRPRQRYPLALGNYPETDIISPLVYCDACTSTVLSLKKPIKEQIFTAALALVKLTHSTNRSSWVSALDTAFEERFHTEDLLLIFLAVVHNSMNRWSALDSGDHTFALHALKWASNNLMNTAGIPLELSATPEMFTNTDLITVKSFVAVVPVRLARMGPEDWAFMKYPLDGFEVFIHALCQLDHAGGKPEDVLRLVWLRLLFHVTEQFHSMQKSEGAEKAKTSIAQLLSLNNALQPDGRDLITVDVLQGTMMPDEEFACFQKMPPFTEICAKGAKSLTVLMNALANVDETFESPAELFEDFKCQFHLDKVFREPFA